MMNQAAGAFGRGTAPLTAQNIQAGSQPFYNAMMHQFTEGTGQGTLSDITSRFGALDSARSSGLGNVIGRQTASFAPAAQSMFLANRAQDAGTGLAGMRLGMGVGTQQDMLSQAQAGGQLQKWQMGLPGMDPRMNYLPLALGTPAFGNIGMPGQKSPMETLAPMLPFLMMM
jgi:hypothetical protein